MSDSSRLRLDRQLFKGCKEALSPNHRRAFGQICESVSEGGVQCAAVYSRQRGIEVTSKAEGPVKHRQSVTLDDVQGQKIGQAGLEPATKGL